MTAELIAALHRERAGYLTHGRTDRAEQVTTALAEMGAPVDEPDTTTRVRPTRRAKDTPT